MKTRFILPALMLAALSFAGQEVYKFERKFKEGDKDSYKLAMSMNMNGGEVNVTMKTSQLVKKVYENGDADVETTTSDLKVNFNGQEMSPPPQKPRTMRINKNGMPVNAQSSAGQRGMNMNFMRYATVWGSQGLKVGETVNIDEKDANNPKNTVKGTVRLESISDGVAKLITNLDVTTDEIAKPMKIAATILLEAGSSKMNKITGTMSGISAQGMEIEAIQFTMERVK